MATPESIEQAYDYVRQCRFRLITVGVQLVEKQLAGELEGWHEDHPDYLAAEQEVSEAQIALGQLVEVE